jgi:predicted CXXCH cytochrome family protein
VFLAVGAAFLLVDTFRWDVPAGTTPSATRGSGDAKVRSEYCISCHEEQGKAWRESNHHLANRTFDPAQPGAEFAGQTVETHSTRYRLTTRDGAPVIEATDRNGATVPLSPAMVIAHEPLRQFVIETAPGKFQAMEVAWDPAKREWFDVFGGDVRNPGEWGHWTGQGMNWNSMCAHCHMTDYEKRYDEGQDLFRSTWTEQGIGCVQCHGPMTGHEKNESLQTAALSRDPQRMMQTCAACHARAEQLTANFHPGGSFDDHYRLQMMTDGRVYHPDGQILDEDFEWGSFVHSRMFTAGVTCMDCHDSHSGRTRLPATDNNLCMQCHLPGNTRDAPVIDVAAHTFHKPESTGSLCVSCHMSTTTYMQRDPRHDHGFIIPDPSLSLELGTPDACTKCHSDRSQEWSAEAWAKWYGPSPRTDELRTRARAVARAHRSDISVVPDLLDLIPGEKVSAWRASLPTLAARLAPEDARVLAEARSLSTDADPLVRSAAVRALAVSSGDVPRVREALADPVRLVRLDAALALSTELDPASTARAELEAYLAATIEGPVARLRRGQERFQRGERDAGIADVRKAIELDPLSPAMPETLGMMLNAAGDSQSAAQQFERVANLAPSDAGAPYFAALAWAEAGDLKRAEAMFGETVRRDPRQSRAWYNLGLLLSQTGRIDDALRALRQAENAGPSDPDPPYAAATIHAREGRRSEAVDACRRALTIDPAHGPAAALLRRLGAGG